MEENKDCEKFTKGFCVPRDLVVNGELIKTVLLADRAAAKIDDGGDAGFREGPREEKKASIILEELIRRKKKEKLRKERMLAGYGETDISKISDDEISLVEIKDEDFAGISGFSERLFERQFKFSAHAPDLKRLGFHVHDTDYDEYRSKICGKIRDYLFVDQTKSGHLSVELTHEEFLTRQSFLDCEPDQVTTYHWDIEVLEGGFEVLDRNDAALNDDEQPLFLAMPEGQDGKDVVAFPPHALDPEDPRSVWCRCLDHKLLARGEKVRIVNVYRKVECCDLNCGHPDCGKLIRLDETKDDEKKFYVSTDESCIDLMFKGAPPASELPPQVEYCLGRCENPPVINSGGR